jgi:hypothetical protein
LAGSIRKVLPVAFLTFQDVAPLVGGLAAAIAVGAFIGQARSGFWNVSEQERRRDTAIGGFIGLALVIGLFLFSGK